MEIGDAVLGPQHPDLATWLNNLATLVRDKGDPQAAEPLQRRAVSIGERVLGPSHPDLGAQVINLASLLNMQGKIPKCEAKYRLLIFAKFPIANGANWRRQLKVGGLVRRGVRYTARMLP